MVHEKATIVPQIAPSNVRMPLLSTVPNLAEVTDASQPHERPNPDPVANTTSGGKLEAHRGANEERVPLGLSPFPLPSPPQPPPPTQFASWPQQQSQQYLVSTGNSWLVQSPGLPSPYTRPMAPQFSPQLMPQTAPMGVGPPTPGTPSMFYQTSYPGSPVWLTQMPLDPYGMQMRMMYQSQMLSQPPTQPQVQIQEQHVLTQPQATSPSEPWREAKAAPSDGRIQPRLTTLTQSETPVPSPPVPSDPNDKTLVIATQSETDPTKSSWLPASKEMKPLDGATDSNTNRVVHPVLAGSGPVLRSESSQNQGSPTTQLDEDAARTLMKAHQMKWSVSPQQPSTTILSQLSASTKHGEERQPQSVQWSSSLGQTRVVEDQKLMHNEASDGLQAQQVGWISKAHHTQSWNDTESPSNKQVLQPNQSRFRVLEGPPIKRPRIKSLALTVGENETMVVPLRQTDGRYKCSMCEKTFKHAKHVRRHGLNHSDVRLYECQVCHTTFNRNDSLARHQVRCGAPRALIMHNFTAGGHMSRDITRESDQNDTSDGDVAIDGSSEGTPEGTSEATSVSDQNTEELRDTKSHRIDLVRARKPKTEVAMIVNEASAEVSSATPETNESVAPQAAVTHVPSSSNENVSRSTSTPVLESPGARPNNPQSEAMASRPPTHSTEQQSESRKNVTNSHQQSTEPEEHHGMGGDSSKFPKKEPELATPMAAGIQA